MASDFNNPTLGPGSNERPRAKFEHTPGPWAIFIISSPAGTSYRVYADNDAMADIAHIPMSWAGDGSNARLIAAAPQFKEAAHDYGEIIKRAQDILTSFLTPDGNDAEEACSQLLALLDGPPWREAHAKYAAAVAKSEGRS